MPRTVLVTGATGTLGRKVLDAVTAAGHEVHALSRNDHAGAADGVHWHRADLRAGGFLDAALSDVEVIVHCATQGVGDRDVVSAERLIASARRCGVAHVVYISIVGVDSIPLPYYRTKLAVERLLSGSGVGHTIVRATQFHELIARIFDAQRRSPVLWALRGFRFQPIDTRDVATQLAGFVDAEPAGRAADIGGPTVHDHADLAHAYLTMRHRRKAVMTIPVPGRIGAGYRSGANLAPANAVGTITFEEYLAEGPYRA